MLQSEQLAELYTALAKAQGAMGPAKYNKRNPHFGNKYADLAAIIDVYRQPLSENGLNVTQRIVHLQEGIFLVTTLGHTSGQFLSSEYPLPTPGKAQEFGSALTYGRRYSVSALLGIAAEEDDDGEGASKSNGGAVVSEKQADEIRALITKTEANIDIFLSLVGFDSVADIPANKYNEAIALLNDNYKKKLKKKAQEAGDAAGQ